MLNMSLWALLALLWGSSFLAIGVGVETLSPALLVAGRMVIGAGILVVGLYLLGRNLRMGRRGWVIAFVAGMTGNVAPFLLISYAGQTVDSGLAALIMGVAPIATVTLAPLVHPDETLGYLKIIGAAIGFSGLLLLFGPHVLGGLGAQLVPQLALLIAALSYASTSLFSRRFPHSDPMQMAAASVLVGAIVICGYVLAQGGDLTFATMSTNSFIAMIYLGVGPTALAAVAYFYLLPRIGAGRLQQVNYAVPVIGVLLGVVLLHERPEWNVWAAMPVILLAVFFVTRKA